VAGSVALLDRAEAFHVRVPFRRPFLAAAGAVTERSSWIVRLYNRDGRAVFGEVALEPGAPAVEEGRVAAALRQIIEMAAAGKSPDWAGLGAAEWRAVRAGWDAVLEDLAAKLESGLPPAVVSVAVNATLEISPPRVAAQAAAGAVSAGFACLKLKTAHEASGALVDRVRAVRAAVGPAVSLRLDANGDWDYAMAAGLLADLAGFDIEYVEQPLPRDDLDGHARLRRHSAIPIALDETIDCEAAASAAIAARAADVLVVKPARVGGPAVVRAIAALAASAGVPVVLSTFFETGVGTAAAIRAAGALPSVGRERAHGLATAGLLEHDLLIEPCAVDRGRITLPAELVLDEDALRHYTVETLKTAP
jgi:o-succinylbenzoate synthase